MHRASTAWTSGSGNCESVDGGSVSDNVGGCGNGSVGLLSFNLGKIELSYDGLGALLEVQGATDTAAHNADGDGNGNGQHRV